MYAANAFRHMLGAPLWMTTMQPEGTPGRQADWDGQHSAPLLDNLAAALHDRDGTPLTGAANFTAALEWFAPRYQAWKADPSQVITEADVLAVLPSFFSNALVHSSCPSAASGACPSQEVFRYTPCGVHAVATSG